jgi:hypothetical protein|tara:strand:+ start:436 stop:609 length:174 start_codon:yes stop_codon:yes gene_type:complete
MARKEETIEDILDRMDDDIMSIRDKIENQDEEDFEGEEDYSDSGDWDSEFEDSEESK